MNLTFRNADTPAKKGYNQPSGSHLINLINKEWNQCFLEIDEYQRDKVMSITFSTALKGKDRRFSYLLPGQSTTANGESP